MLFCCIGGIKKTVFLVPTILAASIIDKTIYTQSIDLSVYNRKRPRDQSPAKNLLPSK